MLKNLFKITLNGEIILITFLLLACNTRAQEPVRQMEVNLIKGDLHEYFRYRGDGSVIISGHRGGLARGFPENSLEGLENVLNSIPAFFEIDPRLTKDSVIVLLHDETLDRTTNGKGYLRDHTWEQLSSVRLKDHLGTVTDFRIPKLEDVILWSKGKTVVNLDKKDVPPEMIVELIRRLEAEDYIMLTVHTGKQARYYFEQFPGIMLSAFSRNMKEYEDIATSGVPWRNMIAYVGPAINNDNKIVVELLHAKGVRCMISVAPTHDKLATPLKRKEAYLKEISRKPDIIESDIPVEVWSAIQVSQEK
jgi:glycerophosphoryl diester phosphodiesterase